MLLIQVVLEWPGQGRRGLACKHCEYNKHRSDRIGLGSRTERFQALSSISQAVRPPARAPSRNQAAVFRLLGAAGYQLRSGERGDAGPRGPQRMWQVDAAP